MTLTTASPISGSPTDLAAEVLAYGETYAEFSPSGDGIHFIGRGKIDKAATDKARGSNSTALVDISRSPATTSQPHQPTSVKLRAHLHGWSASWTRHERRRSRMSTGMPTAPMVTHRQAEATSSPSKRPSTVPARSSWFLVLFPQPRGIQTALCESRRPAGSRSAGRPLGAPYGYPDHGEEVGLTPVDLVMKQANVRDVTGAAMWLCERMGTDPATLGWKAKGTSRAPPKAAEVKFPHWDVVAWDQPVTTTEILDSLVGVLTRYMVLPEYAADAIALWLLHAWTIDTSDISPYLVIVSPTKQCGKTTLLILIYWLTPKSVLASNVSAASIFRFVDEVQPTLLIDEADSSPRTTRRCGASLTRVTLGRQPSSYDATVRSRPRALNVVRQSDRKHRGARGHAMDRSSHHPHAAQDEG